MKAAVELSPAAPGVWSSLGRAYQLKHDLTASVDAYQHAVANEPANDNLRNDYAYLLVETRQAERAIEESKKVLEHNPSNAAAFMGQHQHQKSFI